MHNDISRICCGCNTILSCYASSSDRSVPVVFCCSSLLSDWYPAHVQTGLVYFTRQWRAFSLSVMFPCSWQLAQATTYLTFWKPFLHSGYFIEENINKIFQMTCIQKWKKLRELFKTKVKGMLYFTVPVMQEGKTCNKCPELNMVVDIWHLNPWVNTVQTVFAGVFCSCSEWQWTVY